MSTELWAEAERRMKERKPEEAICFLAELVSQYPLDRDARVALAITLGDAGNPMGALRIIGTFADRLVHDGFLLAAVAVIHQGLQRAGDDPRLLTLLERLHVRGARAKAGTLAVPPPLRRSPQQASKAADAATLLAMSREERLQRAMEIGCEMPPAGPPVVPVPMPLFGELDTPVFIATVKRLRLRRAKPSSVIIEEGAPGDSLLVLINGQVTISKGPTTVGQLGPGSVIGEMALITRAPRSATVSALEQVDYFELARADVAELSKTEPKVTQELAAYCRGRLLLNLLRTSPLFSHFDEPTRVRLLGRFKTMTIGPGESAVTSGQPAAGLFVIASGQVQVQKFNDVGEPVILATLGPGQVFGEISLLKRSGATADVIATQTVGAIVLPADEFQQMLEEFPNVRTYLENLTSERLQAAKQMLSMETIDADDLVVL